MTTYRDSCGSLRGMIDHQSAGEEACGWCISAEASARLSAESITWHPSPGGMILEPVSETQAQLNRAVLDTEVEAYERDHRPGSGRLSRRVTAPVSLAEAERNRAVLAAAVAPAPRSERRPAA